MERRLGRSGQFCRRELVVQPFASGEPPESRIHRKRCGAGAGTGSGLVHHADFCAGPLRNFTWITEHERAIYNCPSGHMTIKLTAFCFLAVLPVNAQWLDYPTKGVPRAADGKANLTAPAPRLPDGKPDLSGLWLGDQWGPVGRRPVPPGGARSSPPEMLPWAQKVFDERRASSRSKTIPKPALYAAGHPQGEHAAVPVRGSLTRTESW